MNKFLIVFVTLCLTGQYTQAANLRHGRKLNFLLRKGLNGDLHPKHRHLSEEGQLNLGISGRGYFAYRLRVQATDASGDDSQAQAGATAKYDQAYMDNSGTPAANTGAGVGSETSKPEGEVIRDDATDENSDGSTDDDKQRDSDGKFSQTVYSRDGSMHVNRFGYLVDDNGLLLIGKGTVVNSDGNRVEATGSGQNAGDPNARHHIHIPSRAEGIVVTPTGKVLAEELGGSKYSNVGSILLTRFENPQGLNVRLKMKSNCVAADEDGFALGNWCAGSDLDGKDHTYMAETDVSGPGIVGKPGDQGFGRIIR
jgi:hypothetical protein